MKSNAVCISEDMKSWRTEDDMRTLMQAREIQRDPKRMAAVRKLAQEKMADMKKLTQQ